MKNRDVKTQLRQYYQQADMTAPEAAVSAAALLARQETRKRKNRQRITFMQFLRMQVRFVGWKVWTIQGAALIMICWMMVRLYGQGYWTNPQSVASMLGSLSVLVFMTIPPFLYRSNRYGMQEVEAATRFSSARLLLARFIIVGAGDAALLSGILLTVALGFALRADAALVSVMLPFLLAASGSLYLLAHTAPQTCLWGSMGLCGALLLGIFVGNRHLQFRGNFSFAWICLCAVLAAFCCYQLHSLLHNSAYTEMQIAPCDQKGSQYGIMY